MLLRPYLLLTSLSVFLSLFYSPLGLSAPVAPKKSKKIPLVTVTVDSQPIRAAIYVDNKDKGLLGYTPSVIKIPKGEHQIILELPGYKNFTQAWSVQKSGYFTFSLERDIRPGQVDIKTSANDESALDGTLFVDGATRGHVPAQLKLSPGEHVLEVKKSGFIDYKETLQIAEGASLMMVVTLKPVIKKGSLIVSSDIEGAEVFVDGERKDTSPAIVKDLAEGMHQVMVKKESFPTWQQQVQITDGQESKIFAVLMVKPAEQASVRVVCLVTDAQVFVDGEYKGLVNTDIGSLKPGVHFVEVRAKGYQSLSVEQTLVNHETKLIKADLQTTQAQSSTLLRIVSAVPEVDVFVDGGSVGRAPVELTDLPVGKHFVTARKSGFVEWKKEITLKNNQPELVSIDLSNQAVMDVRSNVEQASILMDGQFIGKTPMSVNVTPGRHDIEIQAAGYEDAKQYVVIQAGEQKLISASLKSIHSSPVEILRRRQQMSSYSALTLEPGRFSFDMSVGFLPFAIVRLNAGAWQWRSLGLDAGIELRTTGYMTEGGAHAKLQIVKFNPLSLGVQMFIGGGGGPHKRDTFTFEAGVPVTLSFGSLVRFTARPYIQFYSDRNCASAQQIKDDDKKTGQMKDGLVASGSGELYRAENRVCKINDTQDDYLQSAVSGSFDNIRFQGNPRQRFERVRMMLQATLELTISPFFNVFAMIEGDPVGERLSYTKEFSSIMPVRDYRVYGRLGVTFKF